MALIAQKLGALVARRTPPAVRDLVLVPDSDRCPPLRRDSWNCQRAKPLPMVRFSPLKLPTEAGP
jgi:hypothetical protein